MRTSDIKVLESEVSFESVDLRPPLVFSNRAVESFTLARVRVVVADRRGRSVDGTGATVLSVPWSWPHSSLTLADRDTVLRALCGTLTEALPRLLASDPIRLCCELTECLPEVARRPGEPIPQLAALLCLGAVDNALHDAWARAAGKSAYQMYTSEYLTDDLGALIDPSLDGRYPGDFLGPTHERLPVQHVVAATDPLTSADSTAGYRSLLDWCRTERLQHFKIKVLSRDPQEDADRIGAVHETVRGVTSDPKLAVDPNEGYASGELLDELVDALRTRHPAAAASITYIEQPIPRAMSLEPRATGARASTIPVLMDEGSSSLSSLTELTRSGWSGLVLKAGKGQTFALLAHAYARFHQLFLTVQDLTTVDLALQHSARLASVLRTDSLHLEYNSRQYAPHANARLSLSHPALTSVRDGAVLLAAPEAAGIY